MAPSVALIANNLLHKREQNGSGIQVDLPPLAIIVLVMVGAGFLILMAYGIARFAGPMDKPIKETSAAQHDYMREVRARNLDGVMAEGHAARYGRASTRMDGSSVVSEDPRHRR
ncbi:unnamed protein product [Periconia digitata]|uniref:Uncharacterized protein n=1 Tax=Periconia digitata TaxID=1303443 RepID=A0A9W4UHM1_9PLEO|nr:unnamed protein product [Periconia digitata]